MIWKFVGISVISLYIYMVKYFYAIGNTYLIYLRKKMKMLHIFFLYFSCDVRLVTLQWIILIYTKFIIISEKMKKTNHVRGGLDTK